MFKILRKLFIKNYDDVKNDKVRESHGILVSIVGIVTNVILFVFKFLIGLFTYSMSIIADAINNLSDMGSSIVNLIGFKLSAKPADKEHPFGHQRIEYIAGLIISFVIIALALILGYSSIIKLINKEVSEYNLVSIIILSVAIIIKLWQGLFYRYISKVINSLSIKAASVDSFSDVISTSFVLIGALIAYFSKGKINIDNYIAIGVSIFLIITGIKMIKETANPLIGINPDHQLIKNIENEILSYDGVLGIHDAMIHSYGPSSIYMSVHVEVDYKVDIIKSHELIDTIEEKVGKEFNIILTIHMDPVITDSKELIDIKNYLSKILKEYSTSKISFHDVRLVKGVTTNIIFDVVLPFDTKIKNKDLLDYIEKRIKEINSNYHTIVKLDHDYVS